ncbi:MAG: hypothetical protein HOL56_00365 [Flavobacteriales bacterium]|jgi:hypothetical protein|nr:hypothetical protein [Flavobacteriales bacterium]MBT7620613.1 hypothetical protein [Flavobacteriales bacterium]
MRKIILTIGKIMISIILIIIIKILVHYFIFPSSSGFLGDSNYEGDYHTKLKNPDFIEVDIDVCSDHPHDPHPCLYYVEYVPTSATSYGKEDGFWYSIHDDIRSSRVDVPRKGQQIIKFYEKHPKAIKLCGDAKGRSLTKKEITYLSSARYYLPYIYIKYRPWDSHVDCSVTPSKIFDSFRDRSESIKMSNLLEGRYVMESGYSENLPPNYGTKMQGKLYLFIIPIYILLYWLVSKYRKRKKKRS